MPSKTVVRSFTENCFYHVFNRGVEKRAIFIDEQDFNIFLYYLYVYLTPLEQVLIRYPDLPLRLYRRNLSSEIELVSYCLMPNHFHMLLRQESKDAITRLIKQLTNAYTLYFNNKYQRVGSLLQGPFKAILIETDELLVHISRYVHLNPSVSELVSELKDYKWSSYKEYQDTDNNYLCKKDYILSNFASPEDYQAFVLDHEDYAKQVEKLKHFILE